VFDKSYTLYVPLSLDDLLNWLGGPCILVLDCSGAGALIERFQAVVRQKKEEAARMALTDPERAALLPDYGESILLGCCSASQSLPLSNPALPLDLFTSCLTSPLRVAFKVFALTSPFGSGGRFDRFLDRSVAPGEELLDKIPGKASDRKTPLGELHWIYTAVTDTIAWNILPPSQFQRLFRQDMLLASLLRNFLLATRVMASVGGCTTFSVPGLPHASLIAKHPLWASWDLVLEQYLLALDKYLTATGQGGALAARDLAQRSAVQAMNSMAAAAATNAGLPAIAVCATGGTGGSTAASGGVVGVQVGVAASPAAAAALAAAQAAASGPQAVRFSREHLSFFSDHLTAFDLSLEVSTESSGPPIQLPIVLQVLLSQVHRRRALVLLARFMGKGSWAVTQALSVGIFPYVLKLLQSPDVPLREVLVFIWSKLLALDRSVQADVVREGHELYFVNHLASPPAAGGPGPAPHGQGHGHGHGQGAHHPQGGVTERQRVMSAFVLAALCDGFPAGQQAVLRTGVLPVLAAHLESESPSLRKWMCLLLGKLWQEHEDAKVAAVVMALPEKLCGVIADPVPEVRAAALYALGTFMASTPSTLYPQQQQHASAPMSQTSSSSTSPAHRPLDNPYGMQQPQQPHLHPQDGGRSRAAIELMLAKNFSQLVVDASPLVREELAIALSRLVEAQADEFVTLAHERSNMQQQPQHANYMSADAEAAAAAHGGGSVPQSPLHTGMSSPGLSPTFAPQQPLHHHHHSSGSVSSSASATPSMGPLRSPSPSPPAQTATGLAIALSPAMMAATGTGPGSTGAANTRVATPLSPLQLQQGGGSVSGGAGSVSSTWNASGATTPLPRTMSASSGGGGGGGSTAGSFVSPTGQPLMQQQQQRQSLTRNNSAGSVYQAGGGGGTVSGGGGSPADAALYHQRLLIWRVVRTLSHDPFPAVPSWPSLCASLWRPVRRRCSHPFIPPPRPSRSPPVTEGACSTPDRCTNCSTANLSCHPRDHR
jgi:regulator-associated protein of mTOR